MTEVRTDPIPAPLSDDHLRRIVEDPYNCGDDRHRSMAAELRELRPRVAELEADLSTAESHLSQALHLCQYGERAPGHGDRRNETWHGWGEEAEEYLRRPDRVNARLKALVAERATTPKETPDAR